jgi:hypothetical protein
MSLDELKSRRVLMEYNEDICKEGRKIVDVKYTVRPSQEFVTEQKAANKRDSNNNVKALDAGMKIDKWEKGNNKMPLLNKLRM